MSVLLRATIDDVATHVPHRTWRADDGIVDPWFNFRATKYLVQNGFYSFWDWFDDRKSSPLIQTSCELPDPQCKALEEIVRCRFGKQQLMKVGFFRDMASIGPCHWRYTLSRTHGYKWRDLPHPANPVDAR